MAKKLVYSDFVVLADKLKLDFCHEDDGDFIPDSFRHYTYRSRLTWETQSVMRSHLNGSLQRGVYSMRAENAYYKGPKYRITADNFFKKGNIKSTLQPSYLRAYRSAEGDDVLVIPEPVVKYNILAAAFGLHWLFEPSYENFPTDHVKKDISAFIYKHTRAFPQATHDTLNSDEDILREGKYFARLGLLDYDDEIKRFARYYPSCTRNVTVWQNPIHHPDKVLLTSFNKLFYAPLKWLCDMIGIDYWEVKSKAPKLFKNLVVEGAEVYA